MSFIIMCFQHWESSWGGWLHWATTLQISANRRSDPLRFQDYLVSASWIRQDRGFRNRDSLVWTEPLSRTCFMPSPNPLLLAFSNLVSLAFAALWSSSKGKLI